jgi:GAF domain-containing protein
VADVLAHLVAREDEKLALADETLGRYKELTLIYDISDKLSRVLDVKEVAELVVDEAKRFLKATTATLLIADRRGEVLEPIASTDERARSRLLAAAGVDGRVLRTGRAEFVEDASISESGTSEPGVCALMCAPLRSGETVFGILRVTNSEKASWTAGHLKLVTSLAGNAGAAMSRAMLHGERLRQQALRQQISRFASPVLLEAAFSGRAPEGSAAVVALFCDVGELARFADAGSDSEKLAGLVRQATAIALEALMREGATVQIANREMLVGLFADPRGRHGAAQAAVRTATRIVRALDRRFGGLAARCPAVAITHADLPDARAADVFFAAVGTAANLQRHAEGRILVDEEIATALGGHLQVAADVSGQLDRSNVSVYEVPP